MAGASSDAGARVVALARTKINNPNITYVWAAPADTTQDNPAHFDCSGFTAWAYYHVTGKKLGHFTGTQFAQLKHRPFSKAQAGDLVFFGPNGTYSNAQAIYHVGIYNGAGGIIEFYDAGRPGRERKLAAHESGLIPVVGICPGTSRTAGDVGTPSPAAQLIGYLRKKFPALKDFQLAAIAGNAQQESQFDPTVTAGGAFGLFQWQGERLAALRAYAATHGMQPTSLRAQIEFAAYELVHDEKASLTALQGSTNLKGAVNAFETHYERAGNPQMSKRENYAQKILSDIRGAGGADAYSSAVAPATGKGGWPADVPPPPVGGKGKSVKPLNPDQDGRGPKDDTWAQIVPWATLVMKHYKDGDSEAINKAIRNIKRYGGTIKTYEEWSKAASIGRGHERYEYAKAYLDLTNEYIYPSGDIPVIDDALDMLGFLKTLPEKLFKWTLDGLLIITGIVCLILAVAIVAKSQGLSIDAPVGPGTKGLARGRHKPAGGAGVSVD